MPAAYMEKSPGTAGITNAIMAAEFTVLNITIEGSFEGFSE